MKSHIYRLNVPAKCHWATLYTINNSVFGVKYHQLLLSDPVFGFKYYQLLLRLFVIAPDSVLQE